MNKQDLRNQVYDLKDQLRELKKEPLKIIGVTVEPRSVRHYRRDEELVEQNEKRMQTRVLVRRDGEADTITLHGKWTLAQVKEAYKG